MSAWSTLSRQLVQIEIEIRSAQAPTRHKALDRLKSLMDTRADELATLFEGHHYAAETTWLSLVQSANEACVQQAARLEKAQNGKGLSAAENKTGDHIIVLQKSIELANADRVNVAYGHVLDWVLHCFGDRWMVRYFGTCYLQVVYEHMLQGGNLEEVKLNDWTRLLSGCLHIYDNVHIQRLTLLQCFPPIVEFGCRYTYLSAGLVQHLPKIEEIIAGDLGSNAFSELIRTIFLISSSIALDYRLTVCHHLETILGSIISAFSGRMPAVAKRTLFQLFHLAITVHSPEGNVCAASSTSYTANRAVWHRHLRNMFHLLKNDIKLQHSEILRGDTNPKMCDVFVSLGAALCAVVFWDNAVWTETDGNGEPTAKRHRRPERLEGVMELVKLPKGAFCWRWMSILAELLTTSPTCLTAEDFMPMLQMLHDFQLQIRYPIEVETLGRLVGILLGAESSLQTAHAFIDSAFCDDIWHKIAQTAFRTTSPALLQGNVDVIRRLVANKRCLPDTFLETVLRTFLSDALRKTNASVRLFIAILRHNNVDALDQADVKEMRHSTIKWLHRQKISLVSTECVEPALIAELTVLCLFTKIDPAVVRRLDGAVIDSPCSEFARFLDTLKSDMLLKSMRRLIIAHRQEAAHKLVVEQDALPQANNLLAVINEQHFDCLFEIINADGDSTDQLDTPNTFNRTTTKLIMYLQLLNQLIAYGSMDRERLDKTFLAKKCHLKLEELEMCAAQFCEISDFSFKDSMDVLQRLRLIFEAPLHPVLLELTNSHDLENVIALLQKWMGDGELDSRKICLRTFAELNSANQRRFETFSALALLAKGANEERAFGVINEFAFNLRNNADILIVLRLLRIVLAQKSTAVKASWCFDQVKAFCQMYYQSQPLMVAIIDLVPDLTRFINQYDSMTDDLLQLFVSFLTLAKKRKYGPHITEKLIRSLISVAAAYPDQLHRDDFATLYLVLSRFLTAAQPLHIQFATVETLSYIFDADWIRSFTGNAAISLNIFHRSLFDEMPLDMSAASAGTATEDAIAGIDRSNRWISVRMQLLSAIIVTSPLLCADAWFQLLDFADQHELSAEYVSGIVRDLCNCMHIDRDVFVVENMPAVLAQWLRSGHGVEKFPWAIESRAKSLQEFCQLHASSMLQNILRWRPAALGDFRRFVGGGSARTMLEPIIAECLAYLIPLLANCPDMPDQYTECAHTMHAVLQENIADISGDIRSKLQQIIECLLCNAWDAKQFGKWFRFDLELELDAHMVNAMNFDKCLAYIQTRSNISGSTLLQGLCNFKPNQMYKLVQHLKTTLQRSRQSDRKLVALYQYAALAQHILEFLHREPLASAHNNSSADNTKTFFVREIINFLCNQLVQLGDTFPRLSLAMLELLHTACVRLLPKRVNIVRPHFNMIVSTLLGVSASNAQRNDNSASNGSLDSEIFASTLRCLRFLIVDQQHTLSVEIALLDNFPAHLTAFDELRQVHAHIKYGGRQFSLREELECFLKVDHRKTEGLTTLREHLSANKTELAAIFLQHEQWMCGAGSGAMAEESGLHRLVVSLLGTIKTSNDEQKRVEAAKCLGELGPSDLGKFMLQPDSQMHTYKFFATFESATKHFCRIVLEALNDLLLHTDVNIVQVSCEAIEFLLEHKDAQDVAENYPYLEVLNSASTRNGPIYATPKTGQPNLELIFAEHAQSQHDVWIKAVVNELLEYFGDHSLKKVAAMHTPFAECALPLLVQMLLACSLSQVIDALRQSVLGFFELHQTYRAKKNEISNESRPLCFNWASIKAMLNVTECIRIYNLFNVNKKINLNYLNVATAAEFCEAHFTAVLYADLWAMEQPAQQMEATCADPQLQQLMRTAYTSIGEPDAVLAFLDPIAHRAAYLHFNKSWSRILLEQDVLPYADAPNLNATKANLAASGLYGLSNSVLSASAVASTYSAHDECLWRLGEWSTLDEQHSATAPDVAGPQPVFERDHYQALHCLHIKDELGTVSAIGRARHAIMNDLRTTSLECTNNVYRHLQRLALVQQIEDFLPVQFAQTHQTDSATVPGTSMNVIDKWRTQDRILYSAFGCRETLLAQRITILRSAGLRAKRRLQNQLNCPVDSVQHQMLLDVAREARHHGELNMAIRYLAQLKHMPALGGQTQSGLWLEDAQLSWQMGDFVLAKRLYRRAIDNTDIESSLSRACAMRIYGECLADTQATDTRSVIDEYFIVSLKLLATIEQQRDVVAARARMTPDAVTGLVLRDRRRAYEAIGKYADREYYSIAMHMRSAQFVQKRDSVAQNEELVVELGKSSSGNADMKRTRIVLQRNTDMDRKEVAATEKELQEYLQLAVKYYVRACSLAGQSGEGSSSGHSGGSVIFRIVSLWLANQANERIVQELRASFGAIASWQFMSVLPQVAVRLTNEEGDFGETVMEIMERCAIDHPQQTIYQILALSNAHVDDPSVTNQSIKAPRVVGATKLVDRLKRNEKTSLIVSQMSEMCQALINYANKVPTDNKRISSKEPIRKLLNLNYVHCPSLTLPISKSAKYPSLTTVHKWSDVLTMVGGINAPKKITCLCSDGRSYPQLLKGKDDMRQDAIMQQVFTILNEMLATNRDTQKARLRVKTYRVVPLTQRSGVLEWCSNTMPLAEYLVGSTQKPGAHERFHPTDLLPTYCRKVISTYHREQKTVAEKMGIFKKVCAQFRPALPYFFLEHFTRPGDWFERRLAYTKSVATTSMIGYILGIGDRHVSNILIDELTAELVHIDFGIAFEQSKCLPTPETIPFRLTRDMVAAIGVSGVDGIFRRSCERTMDVLRQNKRTIITILEVLLYDPLYAWALSAKQAYSRQSIACNGGDDGGIDSKKKNVMAERALTRLEAKLNGSEEGTASGATATVEAHVEVLIKQATNPHNLCRLFEGWQAYL